MFTNVRGASEIVSKECRKGWDLLVRVLGMAHCVLYVRRRGGQ